MSLRALWWMTLMLVACKPASDGAASTSPANASPSGARPSAANAPTKRGAGAVVDQGAPPAAVSDRAGDAPKPSAPPPTNVAPAATPGAPAAAPAAPAVSELLQKRIRYQLREVSPAPVALRELTYQRQADGGAEVVGFYEYSAYEDCVKRVGGSRKAAREQCLPELETISSYGSSDEPSHRQVRLNRTCMRYGLMYAHVAPNPEPDKGALSVLHTAVFEDECELARVSDLRVEDLDRDGRKELIAEVTLAHEVVASERRGQSVADEEHRYLQVFEVGDALRPQLSLLVAQYDQAGASVQWVDLNHDERVDLVQIEDCNDSPYTDADDAECEDVVRNRVWYLYDKELDQWVDDSPRPSGGKP